LSWTAKAPSENQDGYRFAGKIKIRLPCQMLRVKSNPYDPSNRRVTILVKNQGDAPAPQLAPSVPAPAKPGIFRKLTALLPCRRN
jgi:hypothetical protein